MTAPSIAGTTTVDVQDGLAATVLASASISLPAGHVSGDLLILAIVQKNGGSGTISSISTTGTAWAQKSTVGATAASVEDVWYIRDGGSEPSSVTANFSVSGRASLKMIRITGAKASGDPFDVFGSYVAAASATSVVCPSVTTTQNDCLLISLVAAQSGLTGTVTADAAMRELGAEVISASSAGGSMLDLADETRATAGATGSRTWTLGTAANSTGVLFAIAPVAGGATQNAAAAQTVTATQSAAASSTKPVDASQSVTATQAAAASVTKPVDAAQIVTATQSATMSVVPAGISASASQTVTVTQTAVAASTKPVAASQAISATQTATMTVVSAATARYFFVPPLRTRGHVSDATTGLVLEESYGMTVINSGGSFRLVEQPQQTDLMAADAYYLGGHRTEITAAEKAALEAAGYGSGVETVS